MQRAQSHGEARAMYRGELPCCSSVRLRRYTVATGVTGEPMAPGRRSGGAVSRQA
jgi:hypothetical protein